MRVYAYAVAWEFDVSDVSRSSVDITDHKSLVCVDCFVREPPFVHARLLSEFIH